MSLYTAAILIIGDEILSGRTIDTNSNFIAKNLLKSGIKLEEIKVIQDQRKIIINNVKRLSNKYSYVFSTGGIGPTHDDITSESISVAFKRKFLINKEAFKILEKYYPKGEFNKSRQRMAMMPQNVKLIHNPISAAPGFIIKNIYVLPGVPKIMEKMFLKILKNIKKGSPKKVTTINTNLYESIVANELKKIQNKYTECSIGSYPYFNFTSKTGGINIVISSWKMKSIKIIEKEIKEMIKLKGGKSFVV